MQASNLHGQSHQYLHVLSQTESASCHYPTLHVYLEVHLPPKAAALGGKSFSWAKPRRMTKSAGRELRGVVWGLKVPLSWGGGTHGGGHCVSVPWGGGGTVSFSTAA